MTRRVLFSPLGSTDPIRDHFEGPLLHIVRQYDPSVIYLYHTKEMSIKSRNDNRFKRALLRQASLLGRDSNKLEIIDVFTEIDDPSDFDAFPESYYSVLLEIDKTYSQYEVLINISSGTPQMIATACLMTASKYLGNQYKCIQVINPNRKSGEKSKFLDIYSDDMVDNVMDMLEESENRCREPDILFFRDSMNKEKMKKLIEAYNYSAALELAVNNQRIFSEKLIRWLKHMSDRVSYDLDSAVKALTKQDIEEFDPYPVKNGNVQPVYDFYLGILIRFLQNDWGAYLLKLSPLLSRMIYQYINDVFKYPIGKIVSKDRNGKELFRRTLIMKQDPKLLSHLDSCFGNTFKDSHPMLSNMLIILEYIKNNSDTTNNRLESVYTLFIALRKIEDTLRNATAHELVKVTDDWAKKESGYSFKAIHNKLNILVTDFLGNYGGLNAKDLPDRVNAFLLEMIN